MGTDKLDLRLDGETLLERTVRVVHAAADEVLITGLSAGHAAPAGAVTLRDATEGSGPLAGLVAGLRAMSHNHAVVVACDLPHLDPGILTYLLHTLGTCDAAVPVIAGQPQPVCAAYARSALPAAERLLGSGRPALFSLLSEVNVRWVGEEEIRRIDPNLSTLTDVDTPAEWARITR